MSNNKETFEVIIGDFVYDEKKYIVHARNIESVDEFTDFKTAKSLYTKVVRGRKQKKGSMLRSSFTSKTSVYFNNRNELIKALKIQSKCFDFILDPYLEKITPPIPEEVIISFMDDDTKLERLVEMFEEQSDSDHEPYCKRGYHLIQAYQKGDCELLLIALCGWGMHTLMNKVKEEQIQS